MSRIAAALVALALLAPVGLAAQDPATQEQKKIKRNPDLITLEEIDAAGADLLPAYELVNRLRPLWMRKTRRESSLAQATPEKIVYVNEVRRGSNPYALNEMPRMQVREIRQPRPTDATQLFGTDHGSGAILVYLK